MNGVLRQRTQEYLLPDRLKTTWQVVEAKQITTDEFEQRQTQWLREYRRIWKQSLLLGHQIDLTESLLNEIALFTGDNRSEVERRCQRAVAIIADQWNAPGDYDPIGFDDDQYEGDIYDLMWWHTLNDDDSPLGYVTALDFARQNSCRSYLDFGCGVGAGPILFARHGFDVALADLSWFLLAFSQWRMDKRQLSGGFIDLKVDRLPDRAFDIITAMDIFEHLADPVQTINNLDRALRPGGFLFGRFLTETDGDNPITPALDIAPALTRLRELGFVEVWRDEWLWGHQAFQKQS